MDTSLEPWQLAIAIWLQNAVRYLRLLELDEQRARIYNTIYKCEDIKRWARNHARDQVRQINESAARHNPCRTDVHSVTADWNDELHELGLNIIVRAVGGIRIKLKERSLCYLAARQAQEADHTNKVLDWERTEAHDALMMQLDIEGITYEGREGAVAVARHVDSITEMGYNGDS